jgi:endonuclease YncB( thermonuclease family)
MARTCASKQSTLSRSINPTAHRRALINQLVTGHHVDVRPTVDRSYNRIVADLVLPDRRSVGAVMVERGYAWVEARCNNDPSMPTREHAAQQAHLGLWADAHPREWRHEHGHTHVLQRTWRLW